MTARDRIEAGTAALPPTSPDVRIPALVAGPRASCTTFHPASAQTDDDWAQWMESGPQAWLALSGGSPVGTVGLWRGDDQPGDESTLIGRWVATVARGTGVERVAPGNGLVAELAHLRAHVARERRAQLRRCTLRAGGAQGIEQRAHRLGGVGGIGLDLVGQG